MTSSSDIDLANTRGLLLQQPHVTAAELTVDIEKATSANLARLRQGRNIVGLRFARRGYVYPEFQFDRARQRVHPVAARLNRTLLRHLTVETVIAWWLTPNPRLGEAPWRSLDQEDVLLEAADAAVVDPA